MTARSSRLVIQTPEGVSFALELAGPTTRFLAWAIDLAVIIAIWLALIWRVFPVLAAVLPDPTAGMLTLLYFLLSVGYAIVLEWFWRGQTFGKRLLQLRVIDEEGLPLRFSQVVVRNLLRAVDILPAFYLVGGIACLISRRAQRLGDYAANTVVVRYPKRIEPDIEQLTGGKYNSFRDYPHLCARLRQLISPEAARTALEALLRREELDAEARVALFREIADYLRELVAFPEEAAFGLTDEQYVRNVADVVFRTPSAQTARQTTDPDAQPPRNSQAKS